jgi:SAM-dependent methyltransferase
MNLFHRWYCRSSFWKKTLNEKILPWALNEVNLGNDLLEVGPGPGLTTEVLRHRSAHLTAIEIDPRLADQLKQRMHSTNVTVVSGDATNMPFEDCSFSGAVSFTMLHHVPSPSLQDRLLAEVYRVLKPGSTFAGVDSVWSPLFQLIHLFDTMVLVDPNTFGTRLEQADFTNISIELAKNRFRFRAQRP